MKDVEPKVIQPAEIWTQNVMKDHQNPELAKQWTKENPTRKCISRKASPQ